MPALRPLFAAAGVLLLIALVALAVRSGDDTAVPTAGDTVSPGETATDERSPSDDATSGLPSPAATTDDGTSRPSDDTACGIACGDDDGTATDGTATDGTTDDGTTDGTSTDDAATDGTGSDGTATDDTSTDGTDDSGTAGDSDDGTDGSDDGTEDDGDVVAIGETGSDVDDMPDTGAGAATALAGLLALGGAAALVRRR